MRRKSERASKKAAASPEKVEKPEKPKRGRASRRRKASSSEAESAEEEGPQVSAVSAAVVPATEPIVEPSKELAPTEIELGDDKVWQVKAAESTSGLGEIKKLKICLTPRPPPTPERERSPRGRKKLNRTVSSSDTLSEGSDEKRKRRHRSRRLGRDSKDEAENLLEEEEVEDQTKAPSDEPNFTRKEKEDTNQKDIVIPQDSVSIQEHPESTTGEPEKAAGAVDATIVLEKDLHDNAQKAIRQADTTGDSNIEEASKKQREKRHKKLRKEASRSSTDREESPEHDSLNELKPKDLPHQVQVTETKSVKTDDIKFERNNPEVSIPHDSEEGKSQEPERAKSIMEPEYTSEQKQTFEKTSQAEPNIKSVTEPVHITSTQDSPVEPAIEIISKDDRTLRSQSHKISDVPMTQSKNEVFESIEIDKAQTGEKIRSDSEIDKEIKSNSTTIHDSSDAEKDKKPASNATQQDNSNDVKNDILKSKATRQDSSTVDKGDDKKSTTTRQDSSDADNDHRLKSKIKRQDSSDAEKESYIGNPLTNSVIQNHTKDKKDDVIMNMEETSVENYVATPIVVSRKRRWGTRVSKSSQARPVSISTDILKDIIPDVKPVELEEVIYEKRHKKKLENVEKHRVERPVLPKIVIDNTENVNLHRREERERDRERSERERERNEKERERSDRERQRSEREKGKENSSEAPLLEHRKISIVKEDNFVGRPPSPSRHKPSSVLYITNLVRPFTLAQLKNLLQRTGKLIQDGFWIDRIKSKCFVTYENEEQAVETRHALHGVTWPVSNPKTLQVDFSSSEALERMRKAEEEGGGAVSTVPGTVEDWLREQDAKKERFGENDEAKPWERRNVVREWDMGKGDKEKEKLIKRDEKPLEKRRHKTPERSPEPARKFKKKEEEAPAKMLDDLFRKTKAIPCIYWLPLSAETIAVKEEQRRQHMAEHERRMQELERSRAHRRH